MRRRLSVGVLGPVLLVCQCGHSEDTDRVVPETQSDTGGSAGTGGKAALGGTSSGGATTGAATGGAEANGAGAGGAEAGGAEAGGVGAGAGAGAGGGDGAGCPQFDGCMLGGGGRGNVCGGVIADARWLIGTGFDELEGARVVSEQGYATIEDGGFSLYLGTFAGCAERSAIYRIDAGDEGSCDDDAVYEVTGTGPDLRVSGAEQGKPLDCDSFGPGRDLEVRLSESCFPRCGNLSFEVLDEAGEPLAAENTIYLDAGPYFGHGLAGALEAGASYSLRYWFSCKFTYSGCTSQETQEFRREFTATEGLNRLTLP